MYTVRRYVHVHCTVYPKYGFVLVLLEWNHSILFQFIHACLILCRNRNYDNLAIVSLLVAAVSRVDASLCAEMSRGIQPHRGRDPILLLGGTYVRKKQQLRNTGIHLSIREAVFG